MARLGRTQSKSDLTHIEDITALVACQQDSGCTCGAWEQLEAERQRILQWSQDLSERGDNISSRECDLEQRIVKLESRQAYVTASANELREHHSNFDNKLANVDSLLREVATRQENSKLREKELGDQAAYLQKIEMDTQAKEEAVAKEELDLIEERNLIEDTLQSLRQQLSALDLEVEGYAREGEANASRRAEIEKEKEMLRSDELLISEILDGIGPIQQSLRAREARLIDEERLLSEREAQLNFKESHVLPEWSDSVKQLEHFEERALELANRDAETEQHRMRLLQRQREIKGTDDSELLLDPQGRDWMHDLDAQVEALRAKSTSIFKNGDRSSTPSRKFDVVRGNLS